MHIVLPLLIGLDAMGLNSVSATCLSDIQPQTDQLAHNLPRGRTFWLPHFGFLHTSGQSDVVLPLKDLCIASDSPP